MSGADVRIDRQSSSTAKIALFRSLFRGREDVYARRFESRKTGRSGYAPACANEWVRGIAQYAGRLHRLFDGKRDVRIYDYADVNVPMLSRMFDRRCRGYEAIGYTIVLPASAMPAWPTDVLLPADVKFRPKGTSRFRVIGGQSAPRHLPVLRGFDLVFNT
jgi:hypothetical protein